MFLSNVECLNFVYIKKIYGERSIHIRGLLVDYSMVEELDALRCFDS